MQGNATLATLAMEMSSGNGKLDLAPGANDVRRLELSASATLVSGVANATLPGVADLNLAGHSKANVLIGNRGDNWISVCGAYAPSSFALRSDGRGAGRG